METVHFVRFLFQGLVFSESSDRQVKTRDPEKLLIPKGAFGFCFFDQSRHFENGEELWGKEKNFSPKTYFGEVYDIHRVKREMPGEKVLISNMEANGYTRVVVTARGTYPLNDNDAVIAKLG